MESSTFSENLWTLQRWAMRFIWPKEGMPSKGILSNSKGRPTVNDLDVGIEGALTKLVDDTKLGGTVDSIKVGRALQSVLDKSEIWAITNHMKFNKSKCWIQHLGRGNNPDCTYRLGDETLEINFTERNLGISVNGKLNTRKHCAQAARKTNYIPGCIMHSIGRQSRKVVVPLAIALMLPHLEYCMQFWEPWYKKDISYCIMSKVGLQRYWRV